MNRFFITFALMIPLLAHAVGQQALLPQPPSGLWLLPRKDPGNGARADCPGNMKSAPRVVWAYGHDAKAYSFVRPVSIGATNAYLVVHLKGIQLVMPDGRSVWRRPAMGVGNVVDLLPTARAGIPVALVTIGQHGFALLDLADGATLWSWLAPTGNNFGDFRLVKNGQNTFLSVFPGNTTRGLGFEYSPSQKRMVPLWECDYTGKYLANFGPYLVAADMDRDGLEEIVVAGKPAYIGVIDLLTGAVKFERKYSIAGASDVGRPYGLFQAIDLDGDGYRDVVMAGYQVEEYIAVLGNKAGKALEPLWTKYFGMDFPTEEIAFRPDRSSLTDLDDDGKPELIFSLFNSKTDARWHTLVVDPLRGLDVPPLADLPGLYFRGCCDLSGAGAREIVVSVETNRQAGSPRRLQILDRKTFRAVADMDGIAPEFMNSRMSNDISTISLPPGPAFLAAPFRKRGILCKQGARQVVCGLRNGKAVVERVELNPLALTLRTSDNPGECSGYDHRIRGAYDFTAPAASRPLVAAAGGRRELIMELSDSTVIGGSPDLSRTGKLLQSWKIAGTGPACWLARDGRLFLCAVQQGGEGISVFEPGKSTHPAHSFKTMFPVAKSCPPMSFNEILPFGTDSMQIYIGFKIGSHAVASCLYDAQGVQRWRDPSNGPYPSRPAAADLNGDGAGEIVIDNHGRQIIFSTNGQARLLAVGWSYEIPGRDDGAKYAVPIVGPFGTKGAIRIVMAGGLDALETLDGAGARLARVRFASAYDYEWCDPAIARIRPSGWDVGSVDVRGAFACADAETCATRWSLPLGARRIGPAKVVGADIDGDGRDNFLAGLPDGRLVALDEKEGRGAILWQVDCETAIDDVIAADADGDGLLEIIVALADGFVKIFK